MYMCISGHTDVGWIRMPVGACFEAGWATGRLRKGFVGFWTLSNTSKDNYCILQYNKNEQKGERVPAAHPVGTYQLPNNIEVILKMLFIVIRTNIEINGIKHNVQPELRVWTCLSAPPLLGGPGRLQHPTATARPCGVRRAPVQRPFAVGILRGPLLGAPSFKA